MVFRTVVNSLIIGVTVPSGAIAGIAALIVLAIPFAIILRGTRDRHCTQV